MVVNGKIINEAGEPVQSATIFGSLGNGTLSDSNGNFTINLGTGSSFTVSSVGYKDSIIDAATFNNGGQIVLVTSYQSLPDVVVTPVKKSDNTGIVLAAGIGLLLLSQKRKQKRVTGVAGFIGIAAVLFGGYFLYTKIKDNLPSLPK
jgi:hypothetical protein